MRKSLIQLVLLDRMKFSTTSQIQAQFIKVILDFILHVFSIFLDWTLQEFSQLFALNDFLVPIFIPIQSWYSVLDTLTILCDADTSDRSF